MSSAVPLFSVIVPCYGHDDYLAAAIESVWDQEFTSFEIVAIDDGSPDRSGNILDVLSRRSPNPMRVIHTRNRGAHAALNAGAALAEAEYLAFLNDDDLYDSKRLAAFAEAIHESAFVWGFSGIEAIDEAGNPLNVQAMRDSVRKQAIAKSRIPSQAAQALNELNTVVTSGNFVVKTESFIRVGGFRAYKYMHDWDLALRLSQVSEPKVLDGLLYRYRIHQGNAYSQIETAEGLAEDAAEGVRVRGDHEQREAERAIRALLGTHMQGHGSLGAADRIAIRTALVVVAKVRSFPPAYAAARWISKALTRVAGRRRRRE